jgi:hypothetical protein
MAVYATDISAKVGAQNPKEVLLLAQRALPKPRGGGISGEKSAEGIVGGLDPAEGPNMNDGREPAFRRRRRDSIV